jgi:hypothetical protein
MGFKFWVALIQQKRKIMKYAYIVIKMKIGVFPSNAIKGGFTLSIKQKRTVKYLGI